MIFGCAFRFTEDALNAFFGRFQFLFNFATQKFVVIKDWRLGLALRLLQAAILIYVLFDVINKASYLLQEVPKGVISPGSVLTPRRREQSLREQLDTLEDVPYCTKTGDVRGRDYRYEFDGVRYRDFKCVVMDVLAIPDQGELRFFITTYFRVDKIFFVDVPPDVGPCPDPADLDLDAGATDLGNYYGVCVYNTVDQYFPVNPETIKLSILHSYYTSVVDKSGSLPETIIRANGFSGQEIKVRSGENIEFELLDLLGVAGVDLDKRLDEQPNRNGLSSAAKGENDLYPFARVSGVNLIMSFEYYTRALAPDVFREAALPKSDDVLCIVEVSPQYTWSVQGSDVRYQLSDASHPFLIDADREQLSAGDPSAVSSVQVNFERNGVQLTFQVSGNLGKFDFFSLVDALVAGAVLLSVAQLIVTYIALYALGLSSKLYAEFMRESVNWRKEYARFAAQSLVAGSTFMHYDKNDSGTLDRTEIHRYLMEIMEGVLDRPKVACMTDFLMRQGEMEADVSVGRLEDTRDIKISTINKAEWVDIFTEEKVQIGSLKRLVDSEYKDEKIIELLLNLAEGRYVRGFTATEEELVPEQEVKLLPSGVSDKDTSPPAEETKGSTSKHEGGEDEV